MDAKLPDGTILRLPDGMSDDQRRAAVQNYVQKHHPTVAKRVARSFMLGTREAIEGLASPLTLVGDAANAVTNLGIKGINAVAGTEIPELGSMSGALNQVLVDKAGFPTERNDTERMVGAAVKGGSGALTTMGVGMLPAVASAAPRVAAALTTNPVSQAIGGVTGGTAAEGTRQGLEGIQIFENPSLDALAKQSLSLMSGIAGGVAGYGASRGAVNATNAATGTAQGAIDIMTPGGREKIAGQLLRQASGSPATLAARLESAQPPAIPGVRPTTAQALGGDTQLSALELGLRNDPQYRHAFDVRAAENQTARSQALDTMAPQNGGAPEVAALVSQGYQEFGDGMRQAMQAAEQRVQQRLAALGPQADAQAAGGIIREELQAAYNQARAATRGAYRGVDPQGTSSFRSADVYEQVAPLIQDYFANSTAGTPQQLLPILQRLRNSENMTFSQIDGLRQDLQNVAAQAGQAGDRRLTSFAGQAADSIGAYVDQTADQGAGFSPEQAAQYQTARDLRRQQGETFERGQVGQVLKRGQHGDPRVPDSGVPAELFFRSGGSPEATQQFVQAAGGRQPALAALQQYIVGQLRQAVTGPDGAVDANRLGAFQRDYGGALRAFPELQAQVGDLATAQAAVDAAALAETAAQGQMRASPLYAFTTKNPTDAVASIINSANSERAVTEAIQQLSSNPAGVAAFKRAVLNWLTQGIENAGMQPATGDQFQSFAKLKGILDRKTPTLARVFSPDEMRQLSDVAAQMGTENRVTSAKPLGSNTFSNMATRYLVERLSNSYAPMMGQANSTLTPSLGWLTRSMDENMRQTLVDALLNPDKARQVVGRAGNLPVRSIGNASRDTARAILSQALMQGVQQPQRALPAP